MKRKELAEYIDKMSDHIESVSIIPKIRTYGSGPEAKALQEAQPTEEEVDLIRYGAIAALCEVYDLLTGRKEPIDPEDHAEDTIIKTVSLIIDHRIDETLRAGGAND